MLMFGIDFFDISIGSRAIALPSRYARALSGNRASGDAYVSAPESSDGIPREAARAAARRGSGRLRYAA